MIEKVVETLQRGSNAVIAYDMFKPFLDKHRNDLIAKLKTQFRSNDHNLSVYIGLISTLVSLDDIEHDIKKTIRGGEVAANNLKE